MYLKDIDDDIRFKEILTKTLIQSLMDSNFLSYENWLNTSESYTSQEENMETISACLAKIGSKTNTNETNEASQMENQAKKIKLDEQQQVETNYIKRVESHKSFHKFITKSDFNSYYKNCKTALKSNIVSSESSDDIECSQNSIQDQNEDIVLKIASALSNPLTIDLISKLILNNKK